MVQRYRNRAFTRPEAGIWPEALGATKGFINPLELLTGSALQDVP